MQQVDTVDERESHSSLNTAEAQNDFRKRPNLQASFCPCFSLQIKVLRGYNITLGSFNDLLNTPDPYVKLLIPSSPNGMRRTKVQSNTDEVFYFYLDPEMINLLQISLIESDTLSDDLVETKIFDLGTLELNKTCLMTFTFREVSKVVVVMKVEYCTAPTDMHYSAELSQAENEFILKRRSFVFYAMKTFLGERGPQTIDEVPTVAVLGSGGGFRAMVSLSGVFCALKDMRVLDCAMYAAGLSGSAWYLSTLYSHPEWPYVHPRVVRDTLKENINDNWMWLMITPSWMYKHLKIIMEKKRRGQPVSFTDFFGYLVGETILKDRDEIPLLSEQQQKVENALVPFPLYTCVHVKKDVPAKEYCEWLEFSPYEIGIAKYGTFIKTEQFGSKFFCGKLVTPYTEPPLHYLQGLWGSAFTILLQRALRAGKLPDDTIDEMSNPGDLREELREVEDEAKTADELALTSRHIVRNREVEFPFKELLLAEEWAKKNKFKFPPIKAELQYKKHGLKEFYVFRHPKDPTCPIVIHFVLANKTFKEQIKPGVFRETKEEKAFGNFSLFEDRHKPYSTFNFHYREEQFNRLADLNEFNTLLGEQTIKDVIADCIQRRRLHRLHSPESQARS
ncbi:Cytosolic phospholipase A2 [Desmophyllum pertusum]|uniref:Phospholipase A2 n=1 Tax=Desmophyllum pertusum TaxID=174260 RepID=A0A9W9YTY5_9CNID|nr:Cytosolic phospholipase A2 [Desmophyllum pertusum]